MILHSYNPFLQSQDLTHPGKVWPLGRDAWCTHPEREGSGTAEASVMPHCRGKDRPVPRCVLSFCPHLPHPSSWKQLEMNREENRRTIHCWFRELNWFSQGSRQCQSWCMRRRQERAAGSRGRCLCSSVREDTDPS